jgi:hypothetical protein
LVVKYNKIQFYVFTRLIVFCIFNSSKQHSDEVNVKLLANIDEGVAIDLEKVACLLREKDTKKTLVILVSGSRFVIEQLLRRY